MIWILSSLPTVKLYTLARRARTPFYSRCSDQLKYIFKEILLSRGE